MLNNVRRKIEQKDIKKYSELRIEDWWNVDIVSYIRKYSHLGNLRYSKKKISKPFEHSNSQTDFVVPYYQVGDTTYNMIPCLSGSFIKGSNEEDHFNTLEEMKIEKAFLLGETEITQEIYESVMDGEKPSWHKDSPKNPVEWVSWYDALIFCNKLSDMSNLERYYTITKDGKIIDTIEEKQKDYLVETNESSKGFRLPTEWEWEYAAKAGTQLEYSGSDDPKKIGWYDKNSKGTPHPMKQLKPNAWGFYDMSGNVWEWCENESNLPTWNNRVLRGGSWNHGTNPLHSTYRYPRFPNVRSADIGFRIARYI